MSPIDYGKGGDKTWVRLPKVGERFDLTEHGPIVAAEEVSGEDAKGKYNLTKKVTIEQNGKMIKADEDLGYHYRYTFKDGVKLSVSNWGAVYAFKAAEVQEGDCIIINHPEKGKWKVEKVMTEDSRRVPPDGEQVYTDGLGGNPKDIPLQGDHPAGNSPEIF